MRTRVLPILALLAAAPAIAGDGAPETDPFLAALAGKSGPDAVAAPAFDPDLEAVSWSLRPRREIVDALAARLLRGEAKAWYERAKDLPTLPPPPSRIPADSVPGKVEVVDRLASWVPADAAVVFFDGLASAEVQVAELARFIPRAFPALCGDPPGGGRDALRRAVDMLLLPTIWRSNPEVRKGTRQAALVVSDFDLRWAPEIAIICEVDDASLVLAHRKSTFSWEGRGNRRVRTDGLDAVADDGSVRSFFALEGGVALWSTTKALRARILAAGSGKSPSLLAPPAREYALARTTFPAAGGGAILVVPDGFLARIHSIESRVRRAAALRCEAARLLLDARSVGGAKASAPDRGRESCPAGGACVPVAGGAGASCSLHGTASFPTPPGDLPSVAASAADATALGPGAVDSVAAAGIPIAVRWRGSPAEVLVPPGAPGRALLDLLAGKSREGEGAALWKAAKARMRALRSLQAKDDDAASWYLASTGMSFERSGSRSSLFRSPAPPRDAGGVLAVHVKMIANVNGWDVQDLVLEWR